MMKTFAVLALAASATLPACAALPFGNLLHFHPKAPADGRIHVTLVNTSPNFRDVRVDGHIYTVQQGERLSIKAPVGTLVYAGSTMMAHKRGAVLVEMTPQVDHTLVKLD